jgi:hypothetical protein
MAKVHHPIFVRGVTRSGKTVIAHRPMFDDHRALTDARKSQQAALQEATTYAKFAENQKVYINMAKGTGATAYQIAIADWFGAPRVLQIDVDAWTGEIGQIIRVKARDNVKVARVMVVIQDVEQNVLEAGDAIRAEVGSVWWNYTTTSAITMTPFPTVEAIAWDLPGNRDSFAIS